MAMAPKRSGTTRSSSFNKPKSRESAGSANNDHPEKLEKEEKNEKGDKHEKGDKAEKVDGHEKGEKKEKAEKGEKGEKGDKSDKSDKTEKHSVSDKGKPMHFPFRPSSLPPPPEFAGCFCPGDMCTCRYESLQYITPEGLFAPFAPPAAVGPPRVCVWEHLTREDLKQLELGTFSRDSTFDIFKKRFTVPTEKGEEMLWELLYEALRFSRINSFTNKQTSALVSIFYITHVYYVSSLWRLPEDTYAYFKECILLHTVQRPPKSAEIFEPGQSQKALKHFVTMYLRHLPLVHLACLPLARLQLIWPMRYDRTSMNNTKYPDWIDPVQGDTNAAGRVSAPSDWPTTLSDAVVPIDRVHLQLQFMRSYRPTMTPIPRGTQDSADVPNSDPVNRRCTAIDCSAYI